MKRLTVTTVAAVLTLCAAAPAPAQSREHQQMAAELRIMQERIAEMALANEKALAQLTTQLTATVKAINERLEALDSATRKSLADQKVVIDTLSTELRVIRQNTQETSTRLRTIGDEIDALGNAVSQLNVSSPSPSLSSADPAAPPAAAPAGTSPVPRSGLSPARLYDQAWFDYTAGNLPLAISGFERYLAEYPKTDKADDAQYHIGLSQKKLKKVPEAIAAFTAVIQNYPNESFVDEAYYELGEAQRSLGQIEAARTAWQTVITRFPESDGALLAGQRIAGLPAPPSPPPSPPAPR